MNKNNRIRISIIASILIMACACPISGLPSITGDPTEPPQILVSTLPAQPIQPQQDTQPANILFSDDFNVPSGEFEEFSDDNGAVGTKDGVYSVVSNIGLWNWGRSTSEYSDVTAEFDVTMVNGPSTTNAGVGLYCRLSFGDDTSLNGYLLAISLDGYYAILDFTAGSPAPLVDWTPSDIVNQGSASNHIRATCDGNTLELEVNGQVVATTVAGSTIAGPIAFAAVSFQDGEPNMEAHFDNLVVSQP